VQKNRPCPLLKKGHPPKIPFARWQVLTWGENQKEGGESSLVSTP